MNVFRVFVIVLAFSIIAGAIVHIRLKNWHYAYLINQFYDKNQRLGQEFTQIRLEMARYQNPENLLERLKEMNLPLEGLGMTTQQPAKSPVKSTGILPAKSSTKSPSKSAVKTAKPAPRRTNPTQTH
ncbi:MAG: hypothetical protein GX629_00535 [Phycisphaerae bacterium]|jgi:biopolymer transport protein ExbB/TolQ|nr:hypothetical protein [Phycisphaerae bacterium]